MLVIARKKEQAVLVKFGDTVVKLIYAGWKNGAAQMVFDAPQEVRIVREELELEPKGESA